MCVYIFVYKGVRMSYLSVRVRHFFVAKDTDAEWNGIKVIVQTFTNQDPSPFILDKTFIRIRDF